MFVERINNSHAGRKVPRWKYVLLLVAPSLAMTLYPSRAQAQIVGDLVANVPFEFHVANTTLPAGEYRIQVMEDSNLNVMEIRNMDDSNSVLFQVHETDANATPTKSELIFNRYGDTYFLSELFEQGSDSGSQVVESKDEQVKSQQSTLAQEHVPARSGMQRGN